MKKPPQIVATVVNTVMGVKADDESNAQVPIGEALRTQPTQVDAVVDWRAIALYLGGTILQVLVMILALWGLQQITPHVPNQWAIYPAIAFFAFVSVRSRLFSILDNTRSGRTYDTVQRPDWAPPPLAFPIIWMSIAVLRTLASYWVWNAYDQNYLALPLILYVVHLALGDTWNTIFTVEMRLGAALPVVLLGPLASSIVVVTAYGLTFPLAGYILLPLCVWLTVASLLVFDIWRLNGREPLYPVLLPPQVES